MQSQQQSGLDEARSTVLTRRSSVGPLGVGGMARQSTLGPNGLPRQSSKGPNGIARQSSLGPRASMAGRQGQCKPLDMSVSSDVAEIVSPFSKAGQEG